MESPKRIYTAFLIAVASWCLLVVAAPVLHAIGGSFGDLVSTALYSGFSRICHQIDSRSLHILGAKLGVCVRCTSIYFSFLAGVVLFPILRPLKANDTPRPAWIVLAVAPMALDALLNDLGILLSSEASRIITGSIAGFVFALFIVPIFIEAVAQCFVHRTLEGDTPYAGKTQ